MSYQFDLGPRERKVSRFLGKVRRELVAAVLKEKSARKLTQQQIADAIGVNRSVINRQLLGGENLTLRRVAEFAWALGLEIVFELRKPTAARGKNDADLAPRFAPVVRTTPVETDVGSSLTTTTSDDQAAAA